MIQRTEFAGCTAVIGHDLLFLDRICIHMLTIMSNAHMEYSKATSRITRPTEPAALGPDTAEPKQSKYKICKIIGLIAEL